MTAPATIPPTSSTQSVKVAVTESAGTEYVILRFNEDTDEWAEHGDHVKASNPSAAIRTHLGKYETLLAGTYLAIPARSWKPVRVTPQTVTTLKLEEAK